jgi:hypothetical protein
MVAFPPEGGSRPNSRAHGHPKMGAMSLSLHPDRDGQTQRRQSAGMSASDLTRLRHAFTYVPSAERGQIAAQFQVTNTLGDGSEVHKSNCNFFRLRGGRFDAVAVYMAG